MNRKQFILVLLALAIVGGAGFALLKRNQQSWNTREAKTGDRVLADFPINDVAAIHVKSSHSDFNITRKAGLWRLHERADYPANYQQIKTLLLKMKDLKVMRSENIGASQLDRVELNAPDKATGSGTLLEFKDAQGKVINSLLVGKRHLRPESESDPFRLHGLFDGCYVLLPNDPENVFLISDDLACVTSEPGAWLNRDFAKVENVKSLSLMAGDGDKLWGLKRETESTPWTMADAGPKPAEELDTKIVSQTVELLAFLNFKDVVAPSDAGTATTNSQFIPAKTLSVQTFDGFSYAIKISEQRPDENYQMAVTVAADIPVEHARDGASDRKKQDQEFEKRMTKLRDKLAKEQTVEQWIYVVEPGLVAPLLRSRAQFVKTTDATKDAQVTTQ